MTIHDLFCIQLVGLEIQKKHSHFDRDPERQNVGHARLLQFLPGFLYFKARICICWICAVAASSEQPEGIREHWQANASNSAGCSSNSAFLFRNLLLVCWLYPFVLLLWLEPLVAINDRTLQTWFSG